MIDFSQLFHVGTRVPDLGRAMEDLSSGMGLHWAEPQQRLQPVWTPASGAAELQLAFTYSVEGPVHVELLQGPRGSLWDGDDSPGTHHLGVWVDDVAAATERLVASGWTLEAASRPPDDGYGAFTYVRSPAGLLLEPVSTAVKPVFEAWWAGGKL